MVSAFSFAATPQVVFGAGKISSLATIAKTFGSKILLVTGANSFISSLTGEKVLSQLEAQDFMILKCFIPSEPTPAMIDEAVQGHSSSNPDVVIAIGGGSAIDAGKAISAMLPLNESIRYYLEGIGTKIHPGKKVPFVAVPTTAGTGSEATKNAVISEVGAHGFKKSLRHNNFVPDLALIDPALTLSCPASTTAASGMDAFTQLLESYLSTSANPVTDALAYEGLGLISKSLLKVHEDGSNMESRVDMALAAYLSGITLANAGLGLVHGFASSIGGFFEIPHGVICSTIMGASNKVTVRKLRTTRCNEVALEKYAGIGALFSKEANKSRDYYVDNLLNVIERYTDVLKIPSLSKSGVTPKDFGRIVGVTDNKFNPATLTKDEILEVLELSI
jgi:alcohol dehydrogenase class IV